MGLCLGALPQEPFFFFLHPFARKGAEAVADNGLHYSCFFCGRCGAAAAK